MTQDLFYYEYGYIDDNYYVYTADAEATVANTFSVACVIGVIKEFNSDLTATFSQTATLSNLYGADLFAFSDAALTAEVSRIRDNNIDVSGVFTVAVDALKLRRASSDEFAYFTLTADNVRVRYDEAALDAAFSLTAEIIRLGKNVEFEAHWTSTATIDCKGTKKANIVDADFPASHFTVTANVSRLRGYVSHLESQFFYLDGANYTAFGAATLSSYATLDIAYTRTRNFESHEYALFTPYIVCNPLRNHTAHFDVTATVTADVVKTARTQSDQSATATLTATTTRVRPSTATLTATATLSAHVDVIPTGGALLTSFTTLTVNASKITRISSSQTSAATLTAQPKVTRDIGSIHIESMFAELAAVVKTGRGFIHLDSTAQVQATAIKTARLSSNLTSTATVAVSTKATKRIQSALTSSATFSAIAKRFRTSSATLVSTATLTTTVSNVIRFTANLQVSAFELAYVDIIHIDTVYLIAAEDRTNIVPRAFATFDYEWTIAADTKSVVIPYEERTILIPYEEREYIF